MRLRPSATRSADMRWGAAFVGDIQKNRHFSGNPLLREHGFCFYAGAPVHAPNGQAIGSLCVMDYKPRRLSLRQKQK